MEKDQVEVLTPVVVGQGQDLHWVFYLFILLQTW